LDFEEENAQAQIQQANKPTVHEKPNKKEKDDYNKFVF
jgi:hypothetical protein